MWILILSVRLVAVQHRAGPPPDGGLGRLGGLHHPRERGHLHLAVVSVTRRGDGRNRAVHAAPFILRRPVRLY